VVRRTRERRLDERTDFLWNEYRGYIEAIDHYISVESAAEWLNEYYPTAINEDSRTAA
jgi:hypothetical protein